MQFVFTGFSPAASSRVFKFEGVGGDKTRSVFTVQIDLALARRYGIPMQELPLLSRCLLDRLDESELRREFVLGEKEMGERAQQRTAEKEAGQRKKAAPRFVNNGGAAWRGPRPLATLSASPNLQAKVSSV